MKCLCKSSGGNPASRTCALAHTSQKLIWGLMSTREPNRGLDVTRLCVLVFSGQILSNITNYVFKLSSSLIASHYSNELFPGQSTGTRRSGRAKLTIGKILGYAQKMGAHTQL